MNQPKKPVSKGGGGNRNRRNQPRRDFPPLGQVSVQTLKIRDEDALVLVQVSLKRGKLGAAGVELHKYGFYSTESDIDGTGRFSVFKFNTIQTSLSDGELSFPLTINLDDPTVVRVYCHDTVTGKSFMVQSKVVTIAKLEKPKKEKPKPKPIKAAKLTITQQPVYREAGYWEFGALVKATDGSVATDGHLRVTGPHGLRMRDIGRSKAGDLILKNVAMPQGSRMFRVYLPDDIDEANVTVTLIESGDHEPLTFTRPEEKPAEEEFPPAHKLNQITARLNNDDTWVMTVQVFGKPNDTLEEGLLTRGKVTLSAANSFVIWKPGDEKPELSEAKHSHSGVQISEIGDSIQVDSEQDFLMILVTLEGDTRSQVVTLRRIKRQKIYHHRTQRQGE